MKALTALLVVLAALAGGITARAVAGNTDPLFVNMAAADAHRANMAISFGRAQLERGHR